MITFNLSIYFKEDLYNTVSFVLKAYSVVSKCTLVDLQHFGFIILSKTLNLLLAKHSLMLKTDLPGEHTLRPSRIHADDDEYKYTVVSIDLIIMFNYCTLKKECCCDRIIVQSTQRVCYD